MRRSIFSRGLSLALAAVLCLSLMLPAAAYDGTCGDNLTWKLDVSGTLTVTGTGEMWNFSKGEAPWYSLRYKIDQIVIEEGVTSVGDYAFYYNGNERKMYEITLPDSLTSIGRYGFSGCEMSEIELPEGLTRIGDHAFDWCIELVRIEIPGTVTELGDWVFYNCKKLQEAYLHTGITEISDNLFFRCEKLTKVVIPDTVTSIGLSAFQYCSALPELRIPSSVMEIDSIAFRYCGSLTDIYFEGTRKQWKEIAPDIELPDEIVVHTADPFHSVTVIGGTAQPASAQVGDQIVITAAKKRGAKFQEWRVLDGEIQLNFELAHETAFLMPDTPVTVEAVFAEVDGEICEACDGEGTISSFGYHPCPDCHGSGKEYSESRACSYCNGKGSVIRVCTICHGKGYIRKPYSGQGVPTIVNGKQYLDVACSACNQTGSKRKTCSECKGRGSTGRSAKTCAACGGKGGWTGNYLTVCTVCGGFGFVERVKDPTPAPVSYVIVFDVGGHGTAPVSQTVTQSASAVRPADPSADGWVFGGWYTDRKCTTAYDFSQPVTKDLNLYAKWTEQTPAPTPTPSAAPVRKNPFRDVAKDQYYYEPVLWAVNRTPQITAGTSESTFSPAATCTRGQVVTFLWRASGCPEPKGSNAFRDVKSSDYYYKAVLWAAQNGITDGTSATEFSPSAPCTRAHVVTFLWRMEGKPAAGKSNPFRDVPAGQYYTDAVLWAVKNNITAGTGKDTFSPGNPCTRGQIVTFLYRKMSEQSNGRAE